MILTGFHEKGSLRGSKGRMGLITSDCTGNTLSAKCRVQLPVRDTIRDLL